MQDLQTLPHGILQLQLHEVSEIQMVMASKMVQKMPHQMGEMQMVMGQKTHSSHMSAHCQMMW